MNKSIKKRKKRLIIIVKGKNSQKSLLTGKNKGICIQERDRVMYMKEKLLVIAKLMHWVARGFEIAGQYMVKESGIRG